MTISELIEKLQNYKDNWGNIKIIDIDTYVDSDNKVLIFEIL